MSGISAMFIAGPRVAEQIGNDYPAFSFLNRKNAVGAPIAAIVLQTLISVSMVWFFNFDVILQYIEITLSLFCLLTVAGVFIIRRRGMMHAGTVKTFLYPFTPILFSAITLWMMAFFIIREPARLTGTAITLASGALLYFIFRKK
jgi:APA family basic amino acid/polyamine antiporter